MKTINIKQLHEKTGPWVRSAGQSRVPVGVTDRGNIVAVLVSPGKAPAGKRKRILLPEYRKLLSSRPQTETVLDDLDAVRGDR